MEVVGQCVVEIERHLLAYIAVDSDKLYPERPDEEDATNHAIVVVGVSEDKVTIYDPGNAVEIDIKKHLFASAWHESRYYMVSVK